MPYAVTFTSANGFKQTFPLDWLLERKALIATQVGGGPLSESFGGTNQLWLSGAAARLFVRDIVSIQFDEVEVAPEPPSFEADGMLFQNRPNVGAGAATEPLPGIEGMRAYPVGQEIAFEGWAYDFDRTIEALEFSLDQGETWTRYETPGTDPDRWVRWEFAYAPQRPATTSCGCAASTSTAPQAPNPRTTPLACGSFQPPAQKSARPFTRTGGLFALNIFAGHQLRAQSTLSVFSKFQNRVQKKQL